LFYSAAQSVSSLLRPPPQSISFLLKASHLSSDLLLTASPLSSDLLLKASHLSSDLLLKASPLSSDLLKVSPLSSLLSPQTFYQSHSYNFNEWPRPPKYIHHPYIYIYTTIQSSSRRNVLIFQSTVFINEDNMK